MKFLKTGKEIAAAIEDLLLRCKGLRWAVAWASHEFPLFHLLKQNEDKIHQLAVGIHFYQTHPDFIAAFLNTQNVRFVMNPEGIFHPKLYFFDHGEGDWDCICGSLNFTRAAFSFNVEIAVQISNRDSDGPSVFPAIDSVLTSCFSSGRSLTESDLQAYRPIWHRQQQKLAAISGTYTPRTTRAKPRKSPLDVPLFTADWPEYFASVSHDVIHSIEGRLTVLEEARRLFSAHAHFHQMDRDARRGIAGVFETDRLRWLWFGSMKGHFFFPKAVNENNLGISAALDEIPIAGEITKEHYDRYLALIRDAFEKPGIGTATRLLAFKRPDYFVCLDSKNRDKLCEAFRIPKSVDLDDYWEKVVQRLADSNWWNSPEPSHDLERRIWQCRAAFLDVRFYEPD